MHSWINGDFEWYKLLGGDEWYCKELNFLHISRSNDSSWTLEVGDSVTTTFETLDEATEFANAFARDVVNMMLNGSINITFS